jgi:hypothetical protein
MWIMVSAELGRNAESLDRRRDQFSRLGCIDEILRRFLDERRGNT